MDAAHHHHQWPAHQGIGLVKPMEEFASAMASAITTASSGKPRQPPPPPAAVAAASERKPRPQKEQALNCPRCNSTNTKFCYYNNYSLTQPRYFCKTCRRYWTEGGSLRNVPVGGGSRNNKRCSSSSSTSSINGAPPYKKLPTDHINPPSTISAAPKFHEFADRYPSLETSSSASGLLAPFTPPISTPEFTAARFGLEELRPPPPPPTLNFGLDALGGGYGGQTMLFPFEELKPPMVSNKYAVEHHHQFEPNKGQSGGDHPPTFWSGVINGGGSWWNTTLN